jgi:polysaccharide biosynthesis protein PslH
VTGPRLLALVAYPPSSEAPHGGSRVAAQLLGRLALANHLALVCLRGDDEPPVDPSLADRCELVLEVRRPPLQPGQARLRRLAGLARARPSWVAEWAVPELHAELGRLLETWRPDLVHVHYQVMGQYLPAARAPRVLVVYEPATSRAAAAVSSARGAARRALRYADYLAWRRFERRLVSSVQAVTVFTERDRDELDRLGAETPISVIPFGVEAPERPLDPLGSGDVVLFLGNFAHGPNVDAARRLAETIFPRLRALHPGATLELVGPEPPPGLESEGIVVTGAVPDVTPHLDRAAVFVAPLRLGGGMRVKVLEALAAGKAVVASPLAVEGLEVRDGEELVLADTDDEFAERIAELLGDDERRRALAGRARRFALERLGWDHALAAYERLHASLLSAPAESDHEGVAGEAAGAEASPPTGAVPPAPQRPDEPG